MTEERPKLTRSISTLRLSLTDQVDTPQQIQDQRILEGFVCPHGSDIPLEADFEVSVVAMTNEAIAAVDKVLLKMTEVVHDIAANGVPIKLSKDVYDCLKRRLDTKLNNLYVIARTAAKRVHAD